MRILNSPQLSVEQQSELVQDFYSVSILLNTSISVALSHILFQRVYGNLIYLQLVCFYL